MPQGPLTKNTDALALGLAQVRVGASAANISTFDPVLTSTNSIGALANTKFTSEKEYWKHEAGFPLLEDKTLPLRESAMLECTFEEFNPFNMALAMGLDPVTDSISETLSGEILLGALVAPSYMRMEAVYTFPDGTSTATIVFPRAQVVSTSEVDFQPEDNVKVPVTFEAKRADSDVTDGDAAWDLAPLGHIVFATA